MASSHVYDSSSSEDESASIAGCDETYSALECSLPNGIDISVGCVLVFWERCKVVFKEISSNT